MRFAQPAQMKLKRRQQIYLELLLLLGIFSVSAILPACNTQSAGSTGSSSTAPAPTATPSSGPLVPTPTATPTPSPTPTPTPSPTPNTVDTFAVATSFASPVYSVTHLAANWNTPCTMDVNTVATNSKDIVCTTEVANLDMYFQPMTFSYTAPANGCAYIRSALNWFYQYPVGNGTVSNGPTTITYTIDQTNNNMISGLSSTGPGSAKIVTNPQNGTQSVECVYDYTSNSVNGVAGPNCCSGNYTASITTIATSGSTTATSASSWPGKPGNCAVGAATFSNNPAIGHSAVTGYPFSLIENAYVGFTHTFVIAPPISRLSLTNVSAANYTSTPGAPPAAMSNGAQIYDEFDCLDPAYALIGRIRLLVRKWNLETELLKGATGNPLLTGSSDGVTAPVTDYFGWDEIVGDAADFPGTYPANNL